MIYVNVVKYKQVIIIIIRKQVEKMQQSAKKQSQLLPTLSQILKLYHKYLIFSLQSDQLDDNYIYNGRDPREKTRKEEMQLMREKVRLISKQWTDEPMSNYVNTTMNNYGRDTNFLSTMSSFSGSSNQKSENKLISRFLSRINEKIKIYVDQYSQYNKQLPSILQDNINLINSIGNLTYLSQFFIKLFGVEDYADFTMGLQIKGTNIYGQLSHRNDYGNKLEQQSKKQNKIEEKKSETTKTMQRESIRKLDEVDLILELINIVEIDQKDFKRRYYAFYQIFVKKGSNSEVRESDKQRIQNQNQQKEGEDKVVSPILQRVNIIKSINVPNSSYLFTQILERNKNIAQMIKKYSEKYDKKQKSRQRKQKQMLSVPNITPMAQNEKNRSTSVNTNIVKQEIEIKKISNTLYQGKNEQKIVDQRNKGEKQIKTQYADQRLSNTNKLRIKNKTVGKKLQIDISSINKIGEQYISAMSGQRETENIFKNKEKEEGNQTQINGTKNQNVGSNGSLPQLKINNRFEYIVEGGFNYNNNNFNYYGHNTNAIYNKNKYKSKVEKEKVEKNPSISVNSNINLNANINNGANGQNSTQKVTTHNEILLQKKKQKLARMSKLPLKNSLLFQQYIANSNNNIQTGPNTISDSINISHINYKKIKQAQRQKSSSVISLPNNIDTLNVLSIDQNQQHNQQNRQQPLIQIQKEYSDHHYITHSNLPDNPSMLRSKLLLDKILNKAQSHSLIDASGVTMVLNPTDQGQPNGSILYLTKMQLQAARLVEQNQGLSPMNSHSNSQHKPTKIINHKQKQKKNKKVPYKHELQQRRTKIENMYNKMRPNQFSFVTGVLKSNTLVHGQGYHIREQIQPPTFLMACKSYQKVHTSNQIKNLENKPMEQSEQKNKDTIININILENMGK